MPYTWYMAQVSMMYYESAPKIMSCSRGGCAREHFGLKFAREMSVLCGGMQLKVGTVKT